MDLLGHLAEPVLAIGAGRVTFSGVVASRGVVVVRHGRLRSSYEPVTAIVHRGDNVVAGQVVGLLQSVASHCPPAACLHLGLRDGATYLDPLELFGPRPVHLKPPSGPGDVATSHLPTPFAIDARDAKATSESARGEPPFSVAQAVAVTAVALAVGAALAALSARAQARG